MSDTAYQLVKVPESATRKRLAVLVVVAVGLVLAFWVSITLISPVTRSPNEPWTYSLARMCGLGAGFFVLLQYAMSGRVKWLDRIFGLNRLLKVHRVTAVTAAVLATLHPVLLYPKVLNPLLSPSLTHWAFFLGPLLLVSLWGTIVGGLWREQLGLSFERWWLLHRIGTAAAVIILALHVLNVTPDFAAGWPRWLLLGILAVYAGFYARNKLVKPRQLKKDASFKVSGVESTGNDDVTLVSLAPRQDKVFPYLPGQFAFVRFDSDSLPGEEHHFTLSSSPTWRDRLLYTIKCSGDFSCAVSALKEGDGAVLDGPYGLFSHTAQAKKGQELVMVAGGIGVTPFLSMLRYMADTGDERTVTLIWSNHTEKDIVCPWEVKELEERLPGLRVIHVMTRQKEWDGPTGHVDRAMLESLLKESDRGACCFVCGPPAMMDAATAALADLGYDPGAIHTERFAL